MKRGTIEIYTLIGLLLSAGAKAASNSAGNPYDGIMERNVFNVHPSPPAVLRTPIPLSPPPPKVTFTGITSILSRKLAFLTVTATKPGAVPQSMMLAEGQAQDDIEVKQIDERAGIVKIVNHNEPQTLDFDHDGVKPTGAPPPAGNTMIPPPAPPPVNVIRPLHSRATLSPEEQTALIEIQRVKYQQENNPISKLLPPTQMTPEMNTPAPQ
ncbi:MAG TPA: hypothetical protein VGI88_03075 [Verrucomicrobiae bacterium]|jgi:hypothetical protein